VVISFSSEKPRQQLLDKKYVYTFRKNRRKAFIKAARHYWRMPLKNWGHKDWANEGRTKPRLCYVDIHEIGEFNPHEVDPITKYLTHPLKIYFQLSGFNSLSGWESVISDKAPPFGATEGWLYKVMLQTCSETADKVEK